MLRSKGGRKIQVRTGGKRIQRVGQVFGDRGWMGKKGNALSGKRSAQFGILNEAINSKFHKFSGGVKMVEKQSP